MEATATKVSGLTRAVVTIALGTAFVVGAMTASAIPAHAAEDVWYDLPNYGSSDGEVVVSSYTPGYSSTRFGGTVYFNRVGGSYCTYIQAKGTARWALDGSWFRLTPDRCTSSASKVGYTWSKTFVLAYDGMAFRICGNKPYDTDPCGTSINDTM